MRMLLAVIVALCAFAPSAFADFEDRNKARPYLTNDMPAQSAAADEEEEEAEVDEERPALREGRASTTTVPDRDEDEDKPAKTSRRGGGSNALAIAARYLGTNPTKMSRLWCANFLGMVEKKAGRKGSGSNFARSYASYGKKISRSDARPGDIVVMARGKRGGHVGYFAGWADNGKAIVISGNSRGGKVAKGQYATGRIIAWRRPA
jgi:uncharacterized protein (TIGR02594 family)